MEEITNIDYSPYSPYKQSKYIICYLKQMVTNAVIFTGALRTIKKTIKYFKENVLEASINNNINVDIFMCIQNDSSQSEEDWNVWFTEQMGDHIVSVEWFSLEKHPEWITHRETQLKHINIDNAWKNYLRSSGSMIEYFQLQLAYMAMCQHEQVKNIKYEYVVRARTDSIYAKPVDFHWLNWTEEQVTERMASVKRELESSGIETTPKNLVMYFMCTIVSDDTIPNSKNILADFCPNITDSILSNMDTFYDYIRNGRYILTFRKNNLYIVKRSLFHLIPTLGTMYGFMRSPIADDYWFNAEGQFRDACYYSCVSIFDYNTLLEDKSVLSANVWNETDFFNGDLLVNPYMVYCVVRK